MSARGEPKKARGDRPVTTADTCTRQPCKDLSVERRNTSAGGALYRPDPAVEQQGTWLTMVAVGEGK